MAAILSHTVTEQSVYVAQTTLLAKTRWHDRVTSFLNVAPAPASNYSLLTFQFLSQNF